MGEKKTTPRVMTSEKAGILVACPKTKQFMETQSKQTISMTAVVKVAAITEFVLKYLLEEGVITADDNQGGIRIKNSHILANCHISSVYERQLKPYKSNKKKKVEK